MSTLTIDQFLIAVVGGLVLAFVTVWLNDNGWLGK